MKWWLASLMVWTTAFAAPELTLDQVKKQHQNLKELAAEAEQIKTSPLLLRPMKSSVALSFRDNTLTWAVKGQDPLSIRFLPQGKTEFVGGGKTLKDLPAEARAKLDRTLQLIQQILVMDDALARDFSQTFKDSKLTITPHSKTVYFDWVAIEFKPDANIKSIVFKTADEETRLNFSTLNIKR